MEFFLIPSIFILIFYFINEYIKNFNFLKNYKGQKHQKFLGLKLMLVKKKPKTKSSKK